MKSNDILVGVDFSESSKAALKEAGHIASMRKSWINVVHVIDSEFFEREVDQKFLTADDFRKQAEEALSEFALEALDSPHPSIRFFAFYGNPFEEIMNQAESLGCGLLVIGSYGNRGKSEYVGTMAARLVRKAPLPVLLVRESQSAEYRDIVACCDFSDASRRAVSLAGEVANIHGAYLHLLHIDVVYADPYATFYRDLPLLKKDGDDGVRSHLKQNLEEIASAVRKLHPDVMIKIEVMTGSTADKGICKYIQQVNAGLAVLGTRGRTGFRKMLLGTTAEHVIHKCQCSVLAVKPGDFD